MAVVVRAAAVAAVIAESAAAAAVVVTTMMLVLCRSKTQTNANKWLHTPACLNIIVTIEHDRPCIRVASLSVIVVVVVVVAAAAAMVVFSSRIVVVATFEFTSEVFASAHANRTGNKIACFQSSMTFVSEIAGTRTIVIVVVISVRREVSCAKKAQINSLWSAAIIAKQKGLSSVWGCKSHQHCQKCHQFFHHQLHVNVGYQVLLKSHI